MTHSPTSPTTRRTSQTQRPHIPTRPSTAWQCTEGIGRSAPDHLSRHTRRRGRRRSRRVAWLCILEERHESEIHMQLLMAMKESHTGIVGHEVERDLLKAAQHYDILDH